MATDSILRRGGDRVSLSAMRWVWRDPKARHRTLPPKATGTAHHVLAFLANRADDERWECWPGYDDIKRNTGHSIKTIQRAVDALVELGDVAILRQGKGDSSTLYRLCPSGQNDYTGSGQSGPTYGQSVPNGVVNMTTKPVREPVKNHGGRRSLPNGKSPSVMSQTPRRDPCVECGVDIIDGFDNWKRADGGKAHLKCDEAVVKS